MADYGSVTNNERVLVLESDFAIAPVTDAELREKMDAFYQVSEVREELFTSVGYCDQCDDSRARADDPGADHRACYGCVTGYLLHPGMAAVLLRMHQCMAVDALIDAACFSEGCPDCSGSWMTAVQQNISLPAPVLCSWQFYPPVAPIDSKAGNFRGLFQKDLLLPKGPSAGPQTAQRSGHEFSRSAQQSAA
jgi:hypothetical protein